AQRFTFRSLATVHEHLTNLERKGYIRRAHNESRGIEVVPPRGQTGASELPLYGLVAAGEPIEAVSGSDTIAVPDELVPRRGRSFHPAELLERHGRPSPSRPFPPHTTSRARVTPSAYESTRPAT